MKLKSIKNVVLVTITASTFLIANASSAADSWNFRNGASSDWGRDPTNAGYQANRDVFRVNFSQNAPRVVYNRQGVTFTSENVPNNANGNTTVTGGGIANRTGFSKNYFRARCGVIANGNGSLKRTMASVWLNKVNRVDSFEVDILEMGPGGGATPNAKLNWINWNSNGNGNARVSATPGNQPKWNGFSMANWELSYNNANRTFTAKRNGQSKSHRLDKTRTIGDVIVLHNKAWRFKTNASSAGPVANMRCINASKNRRRT